MKKQLHLFTVTMLLIGAGLQVNAQSNIAEIPSQKNELGQKLEVPADYSSAFTKTEIKSKREQTNWFNYIDDARIFGETYTYFTGSWMYPDSMPTLEFDDGPFNVFNHGGGMVFDPASDFWEVNASGQEWSRHLSYNVDSVAFVYKYRNFGKFTDTVLVSLNYGPTMQTLSFISNGDPTVSVRFDAATNRVVNPQSTEIVLLDSSMTTSNFNSTEFTSFTSAAVELDVDLDVDPVNGDPILGNLFGITVQFLPGLRADSLNQPLANADTANSDSTNLSLFSLLTMEGTGGATVSDPSMNHGMTLFTNNRYGLNDQEWLAGRNAPGSNKVFYWMEYKITGKNVGINDINEDVSFALSPNPANRNAPMYADFKIEKAGNVNIAILDLQGKVVSQITNQKYAPGQHNINANISDLETGMYLYKITTDYGTASKKFIVQ